MICRVGEAVYRGRAIDLAASGPTDLDPRAVATAVRVGRAETNGTVLEVRAREAGDLHERVGCVTPDLPIRPRTALAVAARSRGWSTPVDDRLAAARDGLASHEADPDGPAGGDGSAGDESSRRRLATAEDEIARLRERVAEARGRVQARGRDAAGGGDGDRSSEPLEDAVRTLSEAETAAAAAREERREARAAARAARDRLAERLRLEDEVANCERRARAHLVDRARDAYASALATVPGVDDPAEPFDAPPDAMALAAARVGDLAAPVVVACGRFEDARAAARWLDAPAIRLEP